MLQKRHTIAVFCTERENRLLSIIPEQADYRVELYSETEELVESISDDAVCGVIIDGELKAECENIINTFRIISERELPVLYIFKDMLPLEMIMSEVKGLVIDYLQAPSTDFYLKLKLELLYRMILTQEKVRSLELENEELHGIQSAIERANELAVESELVKCEMTQVFNTSAGKQWVVDEEFNIVLVNDVFLQYLGKSREQIIGKKCFEQFKCSICHTEECTLRHIKDGNGAKSEVDVVTTTNDGDDQYYIANGSKFTATDGAFIGVIEEFQDITLRKRIEHDLEVTNGKLRMLATVDELTQLNNRRSFNESLQKEWGRMLRLNQPLSIVMFDIDDFKSYNDHYGHINGDHALYEVAQVIKSTLSRGGDFVARYGGEEFVAILPGNSVKDAVCVAEKIQKKLSERSIAHGFSSTSNSITLSIGIATRIPDSPEGAYALLEQADNQLYNAKLKGRNRIVAVVAESECETINVTL